MVVGYPGDGSFTHECGSGYGSDGESPDAVGRDSGASRKKYVGDVIKSMKGTRCSVISDRNQ